MNIEYIDEEEETTPTALFDNEDVISISSQSNINRSCDVIEGKIHIKNDYETNHGLREVRIEYKKSIYDDNLEDVNTSLINIFLHKYFIRKK